MEICLQCGDRGFDNAFVDCVKCLDASVHRYCLDVVPETFDEYVSWVCDFCATKPQNPDHDAISSQTRAHERKECQLEDEKGKEGNLRKHSKISDGTLKTEKRRTKKSGVKKDERRLANTSAGQSHYLRLKIGISGCTRSKDDTMLQNKVSVQRDDDTMLQNKFSEHRDDDKCISSKPSDTEPLRSWSKKKKKKKRTVTCLETTPMEQMNGNERLHLENQCAEMSTEERNLGPSNDHIEDRESENMKKRTPAPRDRSNLCRDSPEDLGVSTAEPVVNPIWRGSFDISNKKHDTLYEIVAHMSSKACDRACEAADQFEPVLHLEMLPKSHVWPKSFQTSEPSGDHIALYFFPSDTRNERVFDHLVDKMMRKELALKGVVQNAELLIFTSTELPILYWRFQGKYYLWGVFRGKQST